MANSEIIKYQSTGFGFPLALKPTGKQPLDTRTIVTSLPQYPSDFDSSAAYEGMLVTLLGEGGNHKLYVLENTLEEILDNSIKLRWKEAGGGVTVVSSYADLIGFASEDNIGKTVYLDTTVKVKDGVEVEGENENDPEIITYTSGLYVVIGEEEVNKLAAAATGDQDLASLSAEISGIKQTINDLDVDDTEVANQYVSAVSQENGKITITRADLPTLSDLGGITGADVDTKISTAIGGLDASYTAGTGKYISSINQIDGKISATYADLPKIVNSNYTAEVGSAYTWDDKISNGISNSISINVSYSYGGITNIKAEGLHGVATIDYVIHNLSYEISKLDAEVSSSYGINVYTYANGKLSNYSYAPKVKETDGKLSSLTILPNDTNLVTKEYVDHMHKVLLGDGDLQKTLDTITEISYWLDNNPEDAVNLTLSLAELTEKVNDNETTVATALNEINNKFSGYATVAYVNGKIDNINSRLSWGVI